MNASTLLSVAEKSFTWAHDLAIKAENIALKEANEIDEAIVNLHKERDHHEETASKARGFINKLKELL